MIAEFCVSLGEPNGSQILVINFPYFGWLAFVLFSPYLEFMRILNSQRALLALVESTWTIRFNVVQLTMGDRGPIRNQVRIGQTFLGII